MTDCHHELSVKTDQGKNCYIALLRSWMCFEVVCCHFLMYRNNAVSKFFWLYWNQAVPVFFILSFYFFDRYLEPGISLRDMKKRVIRLLAPVIGWAVIYYVVLSLKSFCACGKMIPVQELLWQLAFGHCRALNAPMWFMFDLIVLTLVFAFLSVITKRYFLYVLYFFSFLCFLWQYTGMNYDMCVYLDPRMSCPVGRLYEMIPYASAGIILHRGMARAGTRIKGFSFLCLITVLVVLNLSLTFSYDFILEFQETIIKPYGFCYTGIPLFLAACALSCSVLLLSRKSFPDRLKNDCRKLTEYTFGIYCVHRLVATFLHEFLYDKCIVIGNDDRLTTCILIYVLSYLLCRGIDKLSKGKCRFLVA